MFIEIKNKLCKTFNHLAYCWLHKLLSCFDQTPSSGKESDPPNTTVYAEERILAIVDRSVVLSRCDTLGGLLNNKGSDEDRRPECFGRFKHID